VADLVVHRFEAIVIDEDNREQSIFCSTGQGCTLGCRSRNRWIPNPTKVNA
jgi:hypothetical protein